MGTAKANGTIYGAADFELAMQPIKASYRQDARARV